MPLRTHVCCATMAVRTETQTETQTNATPAPLQQHGNVTMLPATQSANHNYASGSSRGLGRGRGGTGSGRSGRAGNRPAETVYDIEQRLNEWREEEEREEERARLRQVMNSTRPQSANPPFPTFNPDLNPSSLNANAANIHVPSTPSTHHPQTQASDPLQTRKCSAAETNP